MVEELQGKHLSFICEFYQYFRRKFSKEDKFLFDPSSKDKKTIDTFFKMVTEDRLVSIGFYYYYNFFCFQFSRRATENQHYKGGIEKLPLTWVLGKDAWSLWLKRDKEYDYTFQKFAFDIGVRKEEIRQIIMPDEKKYRLEHEEALKKKYIGSDLLFPVCILYTSLFNRRSSYCLQCRDKSDCKKLKNSIS